MTAELKVMIGIGLVTICLFFAAIWWMGSGENQLSGTVDVNRLVTADSARIGSDSAKVTLVEFGDYQCPSCAFSHVVVKDLIQTYPTQLSFVFRHFPLSQHPLAPLAAQAAEAAGEQGKYWEMHDILYENQTQWSTAADPVKYFQTYATNLSLDLTKFTESVSSTKFAGKIQQGLADGSAINVNATPTFYLNGQKFTGTTQDLKAAVQALISKN